MPPPATCDDPVVGIWKSHKYSPRYGDWTIFTLEIRRGEQEGTLVGLIRNHHWDGTPTEEEPGPCVAGKQRWVVSMDARGTVDETGNIAFGGIGQWRLDEVLCSRGPWGYNLDNFSGTIDPEIQEFQSVNNDGGRAVNEPTVFRRIQCFQADERPSPEVVSTPPPFYPRITGGCSLR